MNRLLIVLFSMIAVSAHASQLTCSGSSNTDENGNFDTAQITAEFYDVYVLSSIHVTVNAEGEDTDSYSIDYTLVDEDYAPKGQQYKNSIRYQLRNNIRTIDYLIIPNNFNFSTRVRAYLLRENDDSSTRITLNCKISQDFN